MKEDRDPAGKEARLGPREKMRTCEILEFLLILKDTDFRAQSPESEPGSATIGFVALGGSLK